MAGVTEKSETRQNCDPRGRYFRDVRLIVREQCGRRGEEYLINGFRVSVRNILLFAKLLIGVWNTIVAIYDRDTEFRMCDLTVFLQH